MKTLFASLILFALHINVNASPVQSLARPVTVEAVDVAKFAGTWYQQAKKPIIFETPCACAIQVLKGTDDGRIAVFNSCNKKDASGELTQIQGFAKATDSTNSKFAVDFGFPWKGDYWIIALDKDYRWAVVTDRWKYSLYILSKTPELATDLYQQAVSEAAKQMSVKKLTRTSQVACSYPEL